MSDLPVPGSWLKIFLPFALGYFLSYLLRTVNAVISPELTRELHLSAADLGLLTSTYFLAFGLAQIPVGIALDRFGPRRVEGFLLLVAAAGAACFALGDTLASLGAARALIGLGVSACLMGALSGFSRWYPRERQSSMTGFIMSAGALGALTASVPIEAALPLTGWRGVFWIIAAIALAASLMIFRLLPGETRPRGRESPGEALLVVAGIYLSPPFLRFAGSSMCFVGGFMALQSLWAVPWLMNVNGLDIGHAARTLVLLNLGMLGGQLSIGILGTHLARRGVKPVNMLQAGYGILLILQLAILFDAGPPAVLWFLLGLLSAVNSQTYLATSSHFPRALFGRVSTATNLMAFAGAFAIQWGMGLALDALTAGGQTMGDALRIAFAGLIALQVLAFLPLLPGFRLPFPRRGPTTTPTGSCSRPDDR
ncbi:MFS transporter [Thauera sinica]|uniref:MFS transporter n=1 Tax=Thauera sinica TaxID=2665146 RepID=A0ABW1AR67_9RHOO|nr:MFS transporter [Thauera sp. K11]ATE59592.1 MFS transporter [Thauera sp. K11]